MHIDSAMIRCPRCAEPMESFSRATGEGTVIAHMCLDCGGVWLDGAVVAKAYPAFVDLDERLRGTLASQLERHIYRCPRCTTPPVGFDFFDIALDHCPGCLGLWVDGDELAALAQTADRADGLPAPAPVDYRSNAASALRQKTVACKGCGASLSLDTAQMTSDGPRCGPCAKAFFGELVETYEPPKHSILPNMGSLRAALGAVGRALDDALNAPPRCPVCDCHAHSRCGHERAVTSED